MSKVRIFQKPKNALQSGRHGLDKWYLEYEPLEAKDADPLMGWAGSGDTQQQLRLSFDTLDAAKAYAERKGLDAVIIPAASRVLKLQAYADNFR
jgi:ETC complex I subunit conserved region